MMSIALFFYLNLIVFAVIGAMRGWAREILVAFSLVLSIFIFAIFVDFQKVFAAIPVIGALAKFMAGRSEGAFYVRTAIVFLALIFGYQSPSLPMLQKGKGKLSGGKITDSMLGFFVGALNGFLFLGTIWYYMHVSDYPLDAFAKPKASDPMGQAALQLLEFLPPLWMTSPWIFIIVALFAAFIIIVFI
ncbi:MAG: hypothetical protein L0Z70_00590 [Chloroflexi bacterium]|nr:hypothetical protein [Chloroflexota bacterium]